MSPLWHGTAIQTRPFGYGLLTFAIFTCVFNTVMRLNTSIPNLSYPVYTLSSKHIFTYLVYRVYRCMIAKKHSSVVLRVPKTPFTEFENHSHLASFTKHARLTANCVMSQLLRGSVLFLLTKGIQIIQISGLHGACRPLSGMSAPPMDGSHAATTVHAEIVSSHLLQHPRRPYLPFPCEIVLVRPSGNMAGRCSDSSGPAVLLSGGNLPAIRPNRPPRPDGPPVRLCPDKGLCWVNCLRVTRRNSPSPRPGAHLTVRPPPRPT